MRFWRFYLVSISIIYSCLAYTQTTVDNRYAQDTIYQVVQLDEVSITQKRETSIIDQVGSSIIIDVNQMQNIPKFLGTSDPIRYMQTLPGVQTNNETRTGIYIQGCDDYQSLVSINETPVYYPNHLLGLFSTFIPAHYETIRLLPFASNASLSNRIGGYVALQTKHQQPKRFSLEGNVGLLNSDLTLQIPCGKKSALWISGRATYLNLLYGKFLRFEDYQLGYNFQDCNLTYALHPTDKDELIVTGFFSRDNLSITDPVTDIQPIWMNLATSAVWNHKGEKNAIKMSAGFSGFRNDINLQATTTEAKTNNSIATARFLTEDTYSFSPDMSIQTSIEYLHYFNKPLELIIHSDLITQDAVTSWTHANETSLSAEWIHRCTSWFDYHLGARGSLYFHQGKVYGGVDPRLTFRFIPATDHSISLQYGMCHQYFHKAGLTGGGLPTDFFFLADSIFTPQWAHEVNLRYDASFLENKYTLSLEGYFKQIYHVVESTGNVLQLITTGFNYQKDILIGSGRNFGLNMLIRKNQGIVTGHISYTLGWALRQLPDLEHKMGYIYSASHERRHDLNVVINVQPAKKWHIGAIFVLASGIPFTKAEEAYLLNGTMICRYSTFNGAHLPIYNRLDLSCSYDIINKNDHLLGINLSLYNVYCMKNAQFVVYRENSLDPVFGTSLSTIIPSISIYGKF